MESVRAVRAVAGQGLEGDRYFSKAGPFYATVGSAGEVIFSDGHEHPGGGTL